MTRFAGTRRAACLLVRFSRMIFLFTLAALVACSSEPPKQLGDYGQAGNGGGSSGKGTPMPDVDGSDGVLGDADGGSDPGTSAPLDGDASALPPPPTTPDAAPPGPADPEPIGSQCEAGDAKEILGKDTPFTKAACGALQTNIDEDFFVLDVVSPKTLLLRVGAQSDAVARLTTPDGKVIAVSNGASANVASAAGKAVVRIRSKAGAVQGYRIVVD